MYYTSLTILAKRHRKKGIIQHKKFKAKNALKKLLDTQTKLNKADKNEKLNQYQLGY